MNVPKRPKSSKTRKTPARPRTSGRPTSKASDADALETVGTPGTPDESGTPSGSTTSSGPPARSAVTNGKARSTTKASLWSRLYHGETDFDFMGRRRIWFALSSVILVIGLGSLLTRGLNLGIDFEGGDVWEVPSGDVSVADARDALGPLGLQDATIQTLEGDEGTVLRVESEPLGAERTDEVTAKLAEITDSTVDDVNITSVGPSWGRQISEKAARALVVFLVLVSIYIAFRFETKMAIPTLIALVHDVLLTVGVYSLTQFEVTPATVVAVLTILGFSIYDGIVVFDKVDENTKLVSSMGGMSYGSMVNLSLNQTLMRSLNTSITAVLPVASLLIIGSWIMGASPLEEFAVALMVGLFSGAYSSIFIASPLLAVLKEREPRYRDIKRRIESRVGTAAPGGGRRAAAVAAAGGAGAAGAGGAGGGRKAVTKRPTTKKVGPSAGARRSVAAEVATGSEGAGSEASSGDEATPLPSGGNGGGVTEPRVPTDRVIPPRPRKKSKGRRR